MRLCCAAAGCLHRGACRFLAREGVVFHIVTDGACWLRRADAQPLLLEQGDLVLLPQGLDHEVVDDPKSIAVPLEDFLGRESFPVNGSPTTTLICGAYLADVELAHPMLLALPPVMHFPAKSVQLKPELAATLSLLTTEIEGDAPGGEALIQHLFDVLFVYIVRAWSDEVSSENQGWLSALKEPSLTKANKTTLVGSGRLKSTNGYYGLRFAHNTDVFVSHLATSTN